MAEFKHHDLRLLNPAYDSPLIDVLQELEHLRKLRIAGTTPPPIFYQLKSIFHMLESIGSARIEGNHTTLADYVDNTLEGDGVKSDQFQEIANIELAMDFIDKSIRPGAEVSSFFVREMHSLTVKGLVREGDKTPGAFRKTGVRIAGSDHLPPAAPAVPEYMDELIDFINRLDASKYDLMKVALAHHRFGWVHPFTNGNGRVVRLLTYALLVKFGFNVSVAGRVLNPTAVFCNDRERYYQMLAVADQGTDDSLEIWCHYVLGGVLEELKKMERLTDYRYLREQVLKPAISMAREVGQITGDEFKILMGATEARDGTIQSKDIKPILPELNDNQRTYRIKSLLEKKMLSPVKEGARQYILSFRSSVLIRGVIRALIDEGFVPNPMKDETPA